MQIAHYTIERICHFKCPVCNIYWSINNTHLLPEQKGFCFYCSREVNELEDSFQILYHFQCPSCQKYWTITENYAQKKKQYCPWCKQQTNFQQFGEDSMPLKHISNSQSFKNKKLSPLPLEGGLPDDSGWDTPANAATIARHQARVAVEHFIRDNASLFFSGKLWDIADKIVTMLESNFGFESKDK